LDPSFGLFKYDPETRFCWFGSGDLGVFEFVGILFGLALYNGVMVRINFGSVFYKKLLKEYVGLDDLKELFPVRLELI
jgi:hypothetical protein